MLLPGAAAQAAEIDYGYNFRQVYVGTYEQTIPVEGNVTSTSVTEAGERVDFRVSVRYSEWQEGEHFPIDGFRTTLDLSSIADDVADIDAVFDDMEFTPVKDLHVERDGHIIKIEGGFDPAFEEFEVTFSTVFARGGDGSFGAQAKIETRHGSGKYWPYGPQGEFELPVIASNPAPLIAKTVDRTSVTAEQPEVNYAIAVSRPEGVAPGTPFVLTDDLADVIREAGGAAPTDFAIERGSGTIAVEDGILRVDGGYDEAGEFTLTFSTPHLGAGDKILQNTACVQGPERETVEQADPNTPVSDDPEAETTKAVMVPGALGCSTAPEVTIPGETTDPGGKPDPGETVDPGGKPDPGTSAPGPEPTLNTPEPTPLPAGPELHPIPETPRLAATGAESPVRATALGVSLAALGGVAAWAAAVRERRVSRQRQ